MKTEFAFEALLPAGPANFINNEWHTCDTADQVFNPATGQAIARVASGTAADVDLAVKAASSAQKSWAKTPQPERARYLSALGSAWKKEKILL